MKKNKLKNWKKRFLIFGLVLVVIFGAGCVEKTPDEKEQITPDTVDGGTPSLPLSVGLSISRAPALGETAEVTYTMASLYKHNISNFSGRIALTEGLEYVSGELSWKGDLLPNQTVRFKAVVKAVKTGNWSIHAWPAAGYGDVIYLSISEDSAQTSRKPFPGTVSPYIEEPTRAHLPAKATLSLSRAPALDQTAELIVKVSFPADRENTSVEVVLPEGVVVVSGDLKWYGPVIEGGTVQLKSTIKAVSVGNWTIKVSGQNMITPSIQVSVSEDSGYIRSGITPERYIPGKGGG